MRLLNLRIIFFIADFCPHLLSFLLLFCFLFFHYVSAKFHLWPSSGDFLPRPRIGMLNLVSVSPVITAFHSCCLSHHVFDQINLWPSWIGIETAIFWQCSPRTEVAVNHLKKARGEIWPKRSENNNNNKTTKMRTKVRNKKINSQIIKHNDELQWTNEHTSL